MLTNSTRVFMLAMLSGIAATAEAQSARIVPDGKPEFRVEYEARDKPVPKWENGYVLVLDPVPENAPKVSVFGPAGSKLFATQFALDGAVHVVLRDIAASSNGVFAVTGGALDRTGAGINFVAYLDSRGAITRVVRLQDFAGRRLCFTDDGRLWVAGAAPAYPGHEAPQNYDVVRVYDAVGNLQGSLVNRSLFASDPTSGIWHLTANRQSVVLFNSGRGDLVEMSYSGDVSPVRRVPLSPETLVTGLALSDNSDIAISCQPSTGVGRIRFLLLDRDANRWVEVYSRDHRELDKYSAVLGFQSTSLLVDRLRPELTFSWVRIER